MFGMMDSNQARYLTQQRLEAVQRALDAREATRGCRGESTWAALVRAVRSRLPGSGAALAAARPRPACDERREAGALGY